MPASRSNLVILPRLAPVHRRASQRRALPIIVLFLACVGSISGVRAQGFGLTKKTVKLERKMPAIVHLPGPGFEIHVTSRDKANDDAAQTLSDLLTVELQKYDKRLQVKTASPDEVINCTITTLQIPPPQPFKRNDVVLQKGKSPEQERQYYKVTGSLSITYQAKDGQSRVLDSDSVSANYSQDFEAGTNQADGESMVSKVTNPFKRIAGKKTDESYGAPTATELRRTLLSRAAAQVAARLVNTDETLEVPLARGKLDQGNDLAEKGLWTRYLETMETMTPLSTSPEDAYRLYNIGVAYEALAYQSEDKKATEKFLEQSAISYGKAIDAKPGEKQFAEPQERIETAVAQYKKLQGGSTFAASSDTASPAASAPAQASPQPAKKAPAKATSSTAKPATVSAPSSASGAANASPAKAAPPAAPAMTNAQIIKMAKAGVDEDNIVATIHDSTAVQFDISPEGLVDLANNGVKGKIVAAMRERMKRPGARPVSK